MAQEPSHIGERRGAPDRSKGALLLAILFVLLLWWFARSGIADLWVALNGWLRLS